MKKIILFTCILIAASGVISYAKEINFELRLPKDRVYPGRQTQLELIFRDASDIPAPEIPFIDGLDIKYIESVKKPAGADKRIAESVTHIYKVAALHTGNFTIGPISFERNGNIYRSGSAYLVSIKEAAPAEKELSFGEKSNINISDHIYLVSEIPKTSIFVNERLPVILKLYSDWIDLENIELYQETSETLVMNDFSRGSTSTVIKDGVRYAVLEYRSSLFAVTPGSHSLDPIKVALKVARPKSTQAELLNDNIRLYEQFIGNSDSRTLDLKTERLDITVTPLPPEGQPEDFGGAVGSFDFNIDAGSAQIKPGDTVMIKMTISGAGNYATLSPPPIKPIDGIKIYEPRTLKADDLVTYELPVRIDSADVKELPAITFSFFDPVKNKYVSIKRGPVPIRLGVASIYQTTVEVTEGSVAMRQLGPDGTPIGPVQIISSGQAYTYRQPAAAVTATTAGTQSHVARSIGTGAATGSKERIVALKDSPGNLERYDTHFYRRKFFILLWVFPVIAIISATIIQKRLRFLRNNPEYAAMLRASKKANREMTKAGALMKKGDSKAFYENAFRIMQNYLGERLSLPTAGITEKAVEAVRAAGVGNDIQDKITKLFSDCYLARYTASDLSESDMRTTLEELKYVIEDLDKKSFKV